MTKSIRWGIIGTGIIARKFAADLNLLTNAQLVAVGSRSLITAKEFARLFYIPSYHGSYEELAADPRVDVVYIATPHVFHFENTMLCLENNKAVLCEKPFSLNAQQAEIMINSAREKNLFLMEAMWTRFLPVITKFRQLLDARIIGEIKFITANLGFKSDFEPQHRIMSLKLGGGALLDIGVYPISLTCMILGVPDTITTMVQFAPTGVDEQAAILFKYANNALAGIHASIRVQTSNDLLVVGTKGQIKLHAPLYRPEKLTLQVEGEAEKEIIKPWSGQGYQYQAAEVMDCMQEKKIESRIMSLADTFSVMQIMDSIRALWGLRYPGELDQEK
jgi:dihydrodiol dehydrogenase / D-xylose 1-dehydrogenase (NADP)